MDIEKVDVTSKVIGKYQDGQLNLYIGDVRIGEVRESSEGLKRKLKKGFVFENNKMYHYQHA